MTKTLLISLFCISCTYQKTPIVKPSQQIADRWSLYHDLVHRSPYIDAFQTVYPGDSALFSCLGYAANVLKFDPEIFLKGGKIIRHPEVSPQTNRTPVSKDMMEGFFWCIAAGKRLDLAERVIEYGKANTVMFHTVEMGWSFCNTKDFEDYKINQETWIGTCVMTPGMIGDLYRMAIKLGYQCDETCEYYKGHDIELSYFNQSFSRHLAVIRILRNGLLHGKIEQDAYNVLKKAVEENPRNALYQAAFAKFTGGDMSAAYDALMDAELFPHDRLPDQSNYKADYLFQRDEEEQDKHGEYYWNPFDRHEYPQLRGFEWLIAASVALDATKVQ